MRSLKLDFLHPYQSAGWPSWLLLGTGLVVAGLSVWHDRQLDHAIAAQSVELRRLDPSPNSQKRKAVVGGSGQITQLASEQLALPWNELFTRLEKVQSKRIALLALEADGRRTEATLTAEARTLNDMLAYVETLKKEAGFKSVTLASHVLREEDQELPYRFVIRLGWRN